jgi:putative membrane protein
VKISGHRKIGLIGAFWLVYFSFFHFPLWSIAVSVWTFIIGNTAPDTLEFSKYDENAYFKRTSLIPHRTYTHWFLLWFLLFLISGGLTFYYHAYWLPIWAYSLGGLMHLLCDLPNPTGVPFLHPKKRRKSLNWWKSGENENIIFILLLFFSGLFIYVIHHDFFSKLTFWSFSHDWRKVSYYLVDRAIIELKEFKKVF